jgi:hypothetical protein
MRNQRRPKQEKPNKPKEQKMKLKTQILAITLGLAASTSLVWSADGPPRETTPPIGVDADSAINRHQHPTMVGVWQITQCPANCESGECIGPPVPALRTFHRDGTMTGYANPPGTGPLDTPEAGVWQREPGSQNYSFHDIAYFYDENGAFAGSGQVTTNVHLTSTNSFTASDTIAVYDADGNLLFTFCGHEEGTRFE